MQLNFKSYGQGTPIVILHGMFGMLDNWQWIAKQLAQHYMVFIVDLRNHGRSPHTEDFSYTLMVEDLHQFMNDNWLYHAVIIGHSMGGKVAMQFALEYPDMVHQLISVDMAPKTYVGNHGTIIKALEKFPISTIKSRTEALEILTTSIPEVDVVQFLLKNLSRDKDTGGYKWKMNLHVIIKNYQHILSHSPSSDKYEGPTLFLAGKKSDYVKIEEFPSFKNNFPNAELQYVKDAGHWVHAEAPQDFLKFVQNFIEKHN